MYKHTHLIPAFFLILVLFVFILTACTSVDDTVAPKPTPISTKNSPSATTDDVIPTLDSEKLGIDDLDKRLNQFIRRLEDDGWGQWILLQKASDIPSQETDLHPASNYQEVIEEPKVVTGESGETVVSFFAWTRDHGILSKWEVTIENETVVFILAEAIDVLVGNYNQIRTEGFIPTAGAVLFQTEVSIPFQK